MCLSFTSGETSHPNLVSKNLHGWKKFDFFGKSDGMSVHFDRSDACVIGKRLVGRLIVSGRAKKHYFVKVLNKIKIKRYMVARGLLISK